MTKATGPAERGRGTASTDGIQLGGALWIMAGVCCAGLLLVVFVGENLLLESPGLSALFLGGAVAALLTGGLLIARPGPTAVRWSTVLGVAWLLAFGSMTVTGLSHPEPDLGPLLSLSLMMGFGIAGALVAYWSGRSTRHPE